MRDLAVWQLIADCLQKQTSVFLLLVVDSQGSSPGRRSFKMAVAADGRLAGSIGGGIMEHNFVERARSASSNEFDMPCLERLVHHKNTDAQQSGMICSGEQTVVMWSVSAEHLSDIQTIISKLKSGKLLQIQFDDTGLQLLPDVAIHRDAELHYAAENDWLYHEVLGTENTAYIIGGGHVSLALSKILSELNFRVVVFDDREDLITVERNQYLHEFNCVAYDSLSECVDAGDNQFVFIVTFSALDDEAALRQIITKNVRYLGLMGSPAKISRIFKNMHNDGFPEDLLAKVRAPIGLHINSQTPEEIAISIAAEAIWVKNQ